MHSINIGCKPKSKVRDNYILRAAKKTEKWKGVSGKWKVWCASRVVLLLRLMPKG